MTRILGISLAIFALAIGAAGAAPATTPTGLAWWPVAHAQFGDAGGTNSQAGGTTAPTPGTTAANPTIPAAQGGANIAESPPPPGPDDTSYSRPMIWIMNLFGWLVGVAALALNYAVYYTVVGMGSYIRNLSAVGLVWQIARDVGNIMLIFGFLMAGIATIIEWEIYGWGSKMLPKLLIAAVLLNFSLFISEAVIDASNLFATQFYTQINGNRPASQGSSGISDAIMAKLGLPTIYGDARLGNNTEMFKSAPWYIGFLGILLFLVTAFVLFSLAFMFIARFVILLYLIIISPIGFAGWILPKLSNISNYWINTLITQALVAPVLLFLLYIALRVILAPEFLSGFDVNSNAAAQTGWVAWISNGASSYGNFASLLLSFLVAMGLLLLVIMVAKKMSAFGASTATSWGGKLSFGATAFVGRRTIGRASNYAARTIRSSRLGATSTGRILASVADRGAKANFDIRGAKGFGNLESAMGFKAGTPQKGGYRDIAEKGAKARTEHAKTLGENQKRERDALRYQAWQMGEQARQLTAQAQAANAQGNQALAAQLGAQAHALIQQQTTIRQNQIQPISDAIRDLQIRYADNLNNWWSQNVPTTGSGMRNEAARQIRNDLSTDQTQRLLQQLQAALNPPPAPPVPPQPPPPAGQPSSIRFKERVRKLSSGIATVMSLNPVSYRYKKVPSSDLRTENEHIGFIAEEALVVEPRLIEFGPDGQPQAFNYQEYTAILTRAVQEQQAEIAELMRQMAKLKLKGDI